MDLPSIKSLPKGTVIVAVYDVKDYDIGPMAVTLINDDSFDWRVLTTCEPTDIERSIDDRPLLGWIEMSDFLE